MTDTEVMGDERLQLHIEAIENLLEERKGITDDVKDRYALAKGEGYDTKTIAKVITRRAIKRAELEEQDALLATYEAALAA
jgi:uncharacterized protein (UPF0335 family)